MKYLKRNTIIEVQEPCSCLIPSIVIITIAFSIILMMFIYYNLNDTRVQKNELKELKKFNETLVNEMNEVIQIVRCKCEKGRCQNCECSKAGRGCSMRCHCHLQCKNVYNVKLTEMEDFYMPDNLTSPEPTEIEDIYPPEPKTPTSIPQTTLTSPVSNSKRIAGINIMTEGELFCREPVIMTFIGKPKSGKSTAIKSIMNLYYQKNWFEFGLVITGTKHTGEYAYLGSDNVWDKYDEKELKEYIIRLKERNELLQPKGDKIPPNYIFFDDLLGDIKVSSNFLNHLTSTYRHTNTYIFLSAQTLCRNVPTTVRSFTEYAFIFKTVARPELKALYNYWFGPLGSFKVFNEKLSNICKQKYSCLVYLNTKNCEDSYRVYQATHPLDYQIELVNHFL